jgi:hypothetical protein
VQWMVDYIVEDPRISSRALLTLSRTEGIRTSAVVGDMKDPL